MTQTVEKAGRAARFHALPVRSVRSLTGDAVEVTLSVPDHLADQFAWLPGQHLPVRAVVDGEELRRNYSICHAPEPGSLTIAIKRATGGAFSTWALEHLAEVGELEAMRPEGRFTVAPPPPGPPTARHFGAIAAGSGVTPVIALVRAQLAESPHDTFTVVYTNRTTMDTMFVDELADLKDRYPDRFTLLHVLTRERRNSDLLSGRLERGRVRAILTDLVPPETMDQWFLCGPTGLVEVCREELARAGVARERIRFELFTTGRPTGGAGGAGRAAAPPPADAEVHTIGFRLEGTTYTTTSAVNSQERVLNAALRVRPDVPYACAGGVCGTCRARVLEGSVEMVDNYALEPEEVAAGLVLTCQSIPTTTKVVVDYDAL
jgi:ring-1,2-phenylacetyl-CoA epoxidase subunit PaaE